MAGQPVNVEIPEGNEFGLWQDDPAAPGPTY